MSFAWPALRVAAIMVLINVAKTPGFYHDYLQARVYFIKKKTSIWKPAPPVDS